MHRSGTSWLTGSLQESGLELGEVNTAARHNLKGNRENVFLQELHEAVLRDNGGSWRTPTWPNTWSRKRRRQLSRHIASMSRQHSMWGFKDPRALMLLDEWHDHVGDLIRVGVYRHPAAVFRSLHARHDDFTEDEALALWRTYNERLLEEHRRAPFTVLRFDVDPPTLRSQLDAVIEELGLPGARQDGFFDEQLVHNRAADDVPAAVGDVWQQLEAIAIGRA